MYQIINTKYIFNPTKVIFCKKKNLINTKKGFNLIKALFLKNKIYA